MLNFAPHREPSVNLWCRMTDTEDAIILADKRPKGEGWLPVVNWKRATRFGYQPYKQGKEHWKRAANERLKCIHEMKRNESNERTTPNP